MARVDVVYFEAGSGHRAAALALRKALAGLDRGWRVRAVDAVDVFDHHLLFGPIVRAGVARFNGMLRRERVRGLPGLIGLALWCHYRLGPGGWRRLAAFWRDEPPDAVVSVVPMFNPALCGAARAANPAALCVTVPVDFEECRPGYWFTPFVDQHYLLASGALRRQAADLGLPADRVHDIGGMPIDPDFYERPPVDREARLADLGLDPRWPTALVSFGGQGSVLVEEVARGLAAAGPELNAILLCGRSRALLRRLQVLAMPCRKAVLGWRPESPADLLALADVIIGKPGSMTIAEAVVLGCPLIAVRAVGMAPVQRGNEAWLEASGVGRIAESGVAAGAMVRQVLECDGYRQRAASQRHRGVFDAAAAIASLLQPAAGVGAGALVQAGRP